PPPRIRADLWVKAQLRLCDSLAIPATIVRRGDPDTGSILVKVYRSRQDCTVFAPAMTIEGARGWWRASGPDATPEPDADAYIARQVSRDNDIWVLEVEDPHGRYRLDGIVD